MPQNTNKDKFSNYSLELNGTNEYITFPETDFKGASGTVSYSFWAKPNTYAGTSNYGYFLSGSTRGGIAYSEGGNASGLTPGEVYLYDMTNAGVVVTATGCILDENTWNHIVIVFNTGNIVQFYKNNSLVTTLTGITSFMSTWNAIGRWSVSNTHFFSGALSEFSIFNYALVQSQVTYLYNLNNPMVISGAEPIAYWPLGDNSNPTALAGYPNVSVGADSVFDFNGTNNYISIQQPSDFALGTIDFTISAWVFATGVPDNNGWIYSQGTNLAFGFNSSGTLRIWVAGVGGFLESTSNFSFNTWQNVVVVRSSGIVTFYINTSSSGSGNRNGSISAGSYSIIGMFNSPNQNPFQGELSNFQLWETALTTAEISTLYNNGQPLIAGTQPQAANLKVWYKLDQSSNWEADSIGNWQMPDAKSAFPQSFKFIQANSDSISTDLIDLGTENSISFWFNFNDAGSTQTIIGSNGTQQYIIQFGSNYIAIRPDGGSDVFNSPSFSAISPPYKTQGVWGHYLITRIGSTIRLFINGDEKAVSGTGTGMGNTVINRIGSNGLGGAYANGEISNVAFWNTNQSSEKDNIYNSGIPATSYTNTPQYWYKLDNTSVWNPAPANYWTFPNAGTATDSGIFNFSN